MVPNGSYGPNYPLFGNYYSREGELIFSGKFKFVRSGLGYPLRKESYPQYPIIEKDHPNLNFSNEEDKIEEVSNEK